MNDTQHLRSGCLFVAFFAVLGVVLFLVMRPATAPSSDYLSDKTEPQAESEAVYSDDNLLQPEPPQPQLGEQAPTEPDPGVENMDPATLETEADRLEAEADALEAEADRLEAEADNQ